MTHHRDPDDLDTQRRLEELLHEAPPPEPTPAAWQRVLRRVEQAYSTPPPRARRRPAGALIAAAVAGLLVWAGVRQLPPPGQPEPVAEVLPVAAGDEVVVLRVEGEDTPTLVVGQLPVQGVLELADPGDVERVSAQADADDPMAPQFRLHGPHRPMIWARLGAEEMP